MAVRRRKRRAAATKKVVVVKTYRKRAKRTRCAKKSFLDKLLDF